MSNELTSHCVRLVVITTQDTLPGSQSTAHPYVHLYCRQHTGARSAKVSALIERLVGNAAADKAKQEAATAAAAAAGRMVPREEVVPTKVG
jgi:hypothetical protein